MTVTSGEVPGPGGDLLEGADTPRPRSGGRYGRCGGCGEIKALDRRGYPYPHNHYAYRPGSRWLSTRRCHGEQVAVSSD
jgi:hypothetical protein